MHAINIRAEEVTLEHIGQIISVQGRDNENKRATKVIKTSVGRLDGWTDETFTDDEGEITVRTFIVNGNPSVPLVITYGADVILYMDTSANFD